MPKSKYEKEVRKDGSVYYYTYEKTGMMNAKGKPEYKKLRAKTIAKLDDKVNEYRKNKAFGIEQTNITVDDWMNEWFKAYKSACRQTTQNFYKSLYEKHIKPSIGLVRLNQVKEHTCQKILNDMSQTHSEKTVAAVRSILFSLFDKAQANRYIITNPAQHLSAKGKAKKQRRELTLTERNKYLKACETHAFGEFAAFLYFFGLRRGEALALSQKDITADTICINKQYVFPTNNLPELGEPKTEAGFRSIPIPIKARQYIDFNNMPNGLVFSNDDGSPLTYSQIIDRWNSFITFALGNDTDITMHCLRHNYCTMLFEQKVDLQTVQELMGHDDIQTTLTVYTHYTEKIAKKSKKKVQKIS